MASQSMRILGIGCLVTGSIVGAGILALPVKTGLAGFVPSLVGLIVIWLAMNFTALIIARQKSLESGEDSDMPTLFGDTLGPVGMWLGVIASLVIYYGLIVAYLSGAGSVISHLSGGALPMWASMLMFFLPATAVALFGIETVTKGNVVLMLLMWAAFAVMLMLALNHVETPRLAEAHWDVLPAALPVILTACNFHFVIPSMCRALDFDKKAITIAFWGGTTVAMVMNALWMVAVVGVLPLTGADGQADPGTLLHTYENNLPATIPLDKVINSGMFRVISALFALVAISTSYLTCSAALVSFCGDLNRRIGLGGRRWANWLIAFVPPLLVAYVEPNIFLNALDVVGGVGIGLLFGILPAVLLYKQARAKGKSLARILAVAMLLCFAFVLVCELAQEAGYMDLKADVESWALHSPVH